MIKDNTDILKGSIWIVKSSTFDLKKYKMLIIFKYLLKIYILQIWVPI